MRENTMTNKQALKSVVDATGDLVVREAVRMVGTNTREKRKAVAVYLRNRGITYQKIATALGVSPRVVGNYVNPECTSASRRRTTLGTTINGRRVILTGLNKRKRPSSCELCGNEPKKMLYYHHWLNDFPSVGMWLCYRCHMLAEVIDKKTALIEQYKKLKNTISVEHIAKDSSSEELVNLAKFHKRR